MRWRGVRHKKQQRKGYNYPKAGAVSLLVVVGTVLRAIELSVMLALYGAVPISSVHYIFG